MHAAKRQSRDSSDDSNDKRKAEHHVTNPEGGSEGTTESEEDLDRKPKAKRSRSSKSGPPHKQHPTSRRGKDKGRAIRPPLPENPNALLPASLYRQDSGYGDAASSQISQASADQGRLASDSLLASVLRSAHDRAVFERALLVDEQRRSDRLLSSMLFPSQQQGRYTDAILHQDLTSSLSVIGINASPAPLRRTTSSSPEQSPTRLLQSLLELQNSQLQLNQMQALPYLQPHVYSPGSFQQRVSVPMLGGPGTSQAAASLSELSALNVPVQPPFEASRAPTAVAPSLSSPVQQPPSLPPPPFKTVKRSFESTRLYHRTTPMAAESDQSCLSGYQTLLRGQILFFETVTADVQASSQGRNKPIRVGQVGLVCRHCCNIPPHGRPRGAAYFPHRLTSIYQSAQNMAKNHFGGGDGCPNAPASINERLRVERSKKGLVYGGGQQYWPQTAREAGVVETDDGLVFAVNSADELDTSV
jgi:hypothetical protein